MFSCYGKSSFIAMILIFYEADGQVRLSIRLTMFVYPIDYGN